MTTSSHRNIRPSPTLQGDKFQPIHWSIQTPLIKEKAKWEDEDWLGNNFPRKLSNGYITSPSFCQEGFAKKLANTVFIVNILSAKMKALKIVDRDSIWLIFPLIDDQKLYYFCVLLFSLLLIFFYVVRINWQFNNYIDFVNIL